MALTDKAIKAFKPSTKKYKKSDADGLYLLVLPTGRKYWKLKYRLHGKEKDLSIGVYPEVSLSEAREKAIEARKGLRQYVDPSEQKKIKKLTAKISSENSFEPIAKEWHERQKGRWTEKYGQKLLRKLEMYIFPIMGHLHR